MKNIYVSRLLKILVFILLLIIADYIIGAILRRLYFHQKTGQNSALNYVLKECNADILIFGASQAQHNYNSQMLIDSLKMSCYNAGADGGHSILLQYAEIEIIAKRYTPKIIILEFNPENVVHYPGDYDRLEILLPYYKDFPETRPLVLLRSPYEKLKLLSSIYPFNSDIINIIRFNTNSKAARKKDTFGYIPVDGVMNNDMLKPDPEAQTKKIIDTNMVNALKGIIKTCHDKNITLFIVSSPLFHAAGEKPAPLGEAALLSMSIIKSNHSHFLDFSYDSTFTTRMDWFKDRKHLNGAGANVFTLKLIELVKKDIVEHQAENK